MCQVGTSLGNNAAIKGVRWTAAGTHVWPYHSERRNTPIRELPDERLDLSFVSAGST